MDKHDVVTIWLWSGLQDFYYGFCMIDIGGREQWPFKYGTFVEFMGLEKLCKAFLLCEKASEYKNLSEKPAKEKVNNIAREYRHNLKKMLREIDAIISDNKIGSLFTVDYDGYTGKEVIDAFQDGYLELRYPVPHPVHENFPIKGRNNAWWNPLGSSAFTHFAYDACNIILADLEHKVDFTLVKKYCKNSILIEESGTRFANLFFRGEIQNFLIT